MLRTVDGIPGGEIKAIPLGVKLGIYSLARVAAFTRHPSLTAFDRGHTKFENDHGK